MYLYRLSEGRLQFPVHSVRWPGHLEAQEGAEMIRKVLRCGWDVTIHCVGVWQVTK